VACEQSHSLFVVFIFWIKLSWSGRSKCRCDWATETLDNTESPSWLYFASSNHFSMTLMMQNMMHQSAELRWRYGNLCQATKPPFPTMSISMQSEAIRVVNDYRWNATQLKILVPRVTIGVAWLPDGGVQTRSSWRPYGFPIQIRSPVTLKIRHYCITKPLWKLNWKGYRRSIRGRITVSITRNGQSCARLASGSVTCARISLYTCDDSTAQHQITKPSISTEVAQSKN
jgi:hypothetical protein